ncbi:MAG: glycosyltransferase [Spirochaetia bacterium]|nr:glycosyltransferase [Spirochaetia bacterium]
MKFTANNSNLHQEFISGTEKHILMITNHGTHQWNIVPGLRDTGGQNIFVNQFTKTLAELGFRVTVVNRGGYHHPITGEFLEGIDYLDNRQRIVYIRDKQEVFIHKEDMADRIPELVECLWGFLLLENSFPDLLISHYWDSAMLGIEINKRFKTRLNHVWIPHSLGSVKKRNMPPETWKELRIDERIRHEKVIVKKVDLTSDTSTVIKESLKNDYGSIRSIFLPPCIDTSRYYQRTVFEDNEIWSFLASCSGLPEEKIRECRIITEISRTDHTKRKDILIKSFSDVHKKYPNTFLVVAIDRNAEKLSSELLGLIRELGIENYVAVIGNEKERMPMIYAVSSIYCSPSIMEGFGMSVQEAAATNVPVVGSRLIPFINEYLVGNSGAIVQDEALDEGSVIMGNGAFMVRTDYINGFSYSLERLIEDSELYGRMSKAAFSITIPYFTWKDMTEFFLSEIGW